MAIEPALVSSGSALLGALAGGGASLAAAVYTQRHQVRLQHIAREITKRETVYAEFIMTASAALVNAYVEDQLTLGRDHQLLLGTLERLRLFAPDEVIQEAEGVMLSIVGTALEPPVDLRRITVEELKAGEQAGPLKAFGKACREDLAQVHRSFR